MILFLVERGGLHPNDEQQIIERCFPLPSPGNLMLSELPEPPIPLSEIGPIPPPPMFSSPSPTSLCRQQQQQQSLPLSDCEDDGNFPTFSNIFHIRPIFLFFKMKIHENLSPPFFCRRRRRRGGRGRQHVRLSERALGPSVRYLAGRGNPRQGAQVPRDASEECAQEEGPRQWARHAAEHSHAGEQAAHAPPGTPRILQVRHAQYLPRNRKNHSLYLIHSSPTFSQSLVKQVVFFLCLTRRQPLRPRMRIW